MILYPRAKATDTALIHEMLCEMAASEDGSIAGTPESLLRHGFGPEPRFRVILAQEGQHTLGFCLFLPEYSSWRGAMGLFVQDIFLRPAARGKGAGRGLLAAAWHEAADWQPDFIALMVKRSNTNAIGFYDSLGFIARDKADPLILTGEGLTALTTP